MKGNIVTKMSGVLVFSTLVLLPFEKSHAITAKVSGHIETTYFYDFNNPSTQSSGGLIAYHPTSNSFYLNNAHVAITGDLQEGSGIGYAVEIDHGSDARAQSNDPAADDTDIQEAYVYFPLGPVNITTGKFVTYEGIEVIEGPSNPTITRGYLYGLAEAFTHVGAKAHMGFGDKVDLGVGVVNGRDKDRDNNKGKTVIWRAGFDFGDPLSFGISGSHGSINNNTSTASTDEDQLTSLDFTGSTKIIPRLPTSFQVLWAQQDNLKAGTRIGTFSGFGIQPVLEISEKLSMGMRVEYFDNLDGANYTATNYTVTPTVKVNDFVTARLEVRRDIVHTTTAGTMPFVDEDGKAKGTQTSITAGVSVGFGG